MRAQVAVVVSNAAEALAAASWGADILIAQGLCIVQGAVSSHS